MIRIYTIDEAAEALAVHPNTIRNLIDRYQLEAIDLRQGCGGKRLIRVTEAAINKYIRESTMLKPEKMRRRA